MLLFVGSLMASRLPTISLKHARVPKQKMPLVVAALLLLVAFLASNFWLAIGTLGVLYIFTVPLTGWLFVRARARYLAAGQAKSRGQAAPTAQARS